MSGKSFAEPAAGIKKVIREGSDRVLRDKEKSLRSTVERAQAQSLLHALKMSKDDNVRKIYSIAYGLHEQGRFDDVVKLSFIASVYMDAKEKSIKFDISPLIKDPLPNLDAFVKKASSVRSDLIQYSFNQSIESLKMSLHKYGPRTRKFLSGVLLNLEKLNQTDRKKSYEALGMINFYLNSIIRNGISVGHGRDEIEQAIQLALRGEDSSSLFSKGLAKNNAYLMSLRIYRGWSKNIPDAIKKFPDVIQLLDKMKSRANKDDINGVMEISKQLETIIPKKLNLVIEENKRIIISRSEKLGEHLRQLAEGLKRAEGLKGYEQLAKKIDNLMQRLQEVRDSVYYEANPSKIQQISDEFSALAKNYSDLVKAVQTYNYVSNMVIEEKSYYDFLKQLDSGDARRMKSTYNEAIKRLNDALGFISKSQFSRAYTALSDALDAKMNMMAYIWHASGMKFSDYKFIKDARMKLFWAFEQGIPTENHMKLEKTVTDFESALRYSGERLFAIGESVVAKRIILNASAIVRMQMDLIDGNSVDKDMLRKKQADFRSDIKLLEEKMEIADHINSWAEVVASLYPPAFVAISLRSAMKEQYVTGNVSWETWAMLGMSVFSLGAVGKGLQAMEKMGTATKIASRAIKTVEIAGGITMLGIGVVHTANLVQKGQYMKALEQLAMFSLPVFHTHVRSRIGGLYKGRIEAKTLSRYHELLYPEIVKLETKRRPTLRINLKKVKNAAKGNKQVAGELNALLDKVAHGEGARSMISTGDIEAFNKDVSERMVASGKYAFMMVFDKSALNSYNNIEWALGDSVIDAYVTSLDLMNKFITNKIKGAGAEMRRVSEKSDEVYMVFESKDVNKLLELREKIGTLHAEAIESTLNMIKEGRIELSKFVEYIYNFKHEMQMVSSSAEISDLFFVKQLKATEPSQLSNAEVYIVKRGTFGRIRKSKVGKIPVEVKSNKLNVLNSPVDMMVENSENNITLTYKGRLLTRKFNFDQLRRRFGIGTKTGLTKMLSEVGGSERFTGHALEFKVSLEKWKTNKKLFYKLMTESTRKGYAEIHSGYFGMRGLNTFFGHPGTDYIASIVEQAVSDFSKSKGIEVKRLGPLKYVITKGYTEKLEHELVQAVTDTLRKKVPKIKDANVNSVFVKDASRDFAGEALISKSLGVDVTTASEFINNSNYVLAVLREYKPQKAEELLGHMSIYDDLKEILNDERARYIRNTEDLFAYFDENNLTSLKEKYIKEVKKIHKK